MPQLFLFTDNIWHIDGSKSRIDHFVALCSMTILLVHIICKSSAMEIHIHLHNTHGCVLEKDNMVDIGGWLQYVHKMQFV